MNVWTAPVSFDDFVVRGRTHRGNEASPLFADGVIYFAGPWSVVYAVDARSGKLIWKSNPENQSGKLLRKTPSEMTS